jgi:hypothetical protein
MASRGCQHDENTSSVQMMLGRNHDIRPKWLDVVSRVKTEIIRVQSEASAPACSPCGHYTKPSTRGGTQCSSPGLVPIDILCIRGMGGPCRLERQTNLSIDDRAIRRQKNHERWHSHRVMPSSNGLHRSSEHQHHGMVPVVGDHSKSRCCSR